MSKKKPEKISEGTHEREYYVSLIFSKEELKKRWKEIGYTPPKGGYQRRMGI